MSRQLNLLDGEARVSIEMKITDADGLGHALAPQSGEAVLIQPGDTVEFSLIPLGESKLSVGEDDVVVLDHGGDTLYLRGLFEALDAEHEVALAFADSAEFGTIATLGDLLAWTASPLDAADAGDAAPLQVDDDGLVWLGPDGMEDGGETAADQCAEDALRVDEILHVATPETEVEALSAADGGGDCGGYLAALGSSEIAPAAVAELLGELAASGAGASSAVIDHVLSEVPVAGTLDLGDSDVLTDIADHFILL